ncbi:hypothetical protein M9458_043696, partial [Cirrhinus mrigala]
LPPLSESSRRSGLRQLSGELIARILASLPEGSLRGGGTRESPWLSSYWGHGDRGMDQANG